MRPRDFGDRIQWDGVQPLLHTEQQCLDDRQRQRELEAKRGALSGAALNFHGAFETLQHALHYVEANAASGNLRNLVGSAKAGAEDERINFRVTEVYGLFGCDQTLFHAPGLYFFGIHASPVVGGLNDHLIALVVRLQMDLSMRGFAGTRAFLGAFDPVAYGIPNQGGQWFGDRVQKTFVEVGVLAAHDQRDFLAALLGYIAYHAWKAAEKLLHGDHADFHHRALQVVQHARLKRHRVRKAAAKRVFWKSAGKLVLRLLQHGFSNDELADQVENAVNAFSIHTQNIVRGCADAARSCECFPRTLQTLDCPRATAHLAPRRSRRKQDCYCAGESKLFPYERWI